MQVKNKSLRKMQKIDFELQAINQQIPRFGTIILVLQRTHGSCSTSWPAQENPTIHARVRLDFLTFKNSSFSSLFDPQNKNQHFIVK